LQNFIRATFFEKIKKEEKRNQFSAL
jgi:hypothetical protein